MFYTADSGINVQFENWGQNTANQNKIKIVTIHVKIRIISKLVTKWVKYKALKKAK